MNNSEAQRQQILEGNIPHLVIKMAIPSVIMQIISLVYNTVDTYFISQLDKSAAAAVGTVFAIQAVIQAVGFGFGMGVSSLCSRKLGEAEDEEANTYASSGVFGAVLTAGIISILGMIFLRPLLQFIGCTDTMFDYARDYARVILIFAPIACVYFVVNNILKAEGHMRLSMYGNLAGTILNIVLDPIFIFALKMGTFGAALATAFSQLAGLVILASQFYRRMTVMKIKPQYISRKWSTYQQIITTGIPTVFRQGLASLASALLCKQASVYGDSAVAGITIANKCYMLIRNIILGIGQGTQPVAGYNYGAGLYKRTKAAFGFAIRIGTVFCVIAAVVLYIGAPSIMWWFCKDQEVLGCGVETLHFAAMVVPVMAFSTFVNQEYQSLGWKKVATFLASCRQGVCFVPIILLMPMFWGVVGVEMAQAFSDFLTFLISIPFYVMMSKHLNKGRRMRK